MQQLISPQVQSGIYRISSAARLDPQLYLERQVDGAILAVELDRASNAQCWSISPVEDGMYRIACVRDNSAITANVALDPTRGEQEASSLWSVEARGNTFIVGSTYGNWVLGIDENDNVQTMERQNVREQRWILHLTRKTMSSRGNGMAEVIPTEFSSPTSDSDSEVDPRQDHDMRSPISDWNFIERMQQMMRTSGALTPPSVTPSGASIYSEADGFHTPLMGTSAQMISDMDALARRLEKQEDELKKLRTNTVQMANEMESLNWRLQEKDEEIRRLNRKSSETVTEVGVLTQRLREKNEEIQRLKGGGSSAPVASESGPISRRVKKFSRVDLKPNRKRASLIRGHKGIVHSVAFSPDGQRIASGGEDYVIRVWDTFSGKKVLGPLRGHLADIKSVSFSPDSSRIVSGGEDHLVNVWDAHTGAKLLGPLSGHGDWVRSVKFSPDGTSIFSGSWDGTVYVWDAMTGAKIKGPSTHQGGVLSITFSPGGTRIVSGGVTGNTLCVWDDTTGNMILGPLLHPSWVRGVAYSPDGAMIASGCKDGNVRLWDATTGALLIGPLAGEPVDYVRSVAFSPDGTRIASAGRGETIHVWDALNGKQLTGTTRKHASDVWCVAFSPDGEWIASGADDGTIRVWPGK